MNLTKDAQRHQHRLRKLLLPIFTSWNDLTPPVTASELRKGIEQCVPLQNRATFRTCPSWNIDTRSRTGEFAPHEAADCIYDVPRTWRFAREIREVTQQFLKKSSGEIAIIDAGCGPYMILGLMAVLQDPKRVRLYCIESNPFSIRAATMLCKHLGLSERVTFINKDARQVTTRDLFGDSDFYQRNGAHIIISETFDSGFREERGPEILKHLSRLFLHRDGVVIPHRYGLYANAGLTDGDSPIYHKVGEFSSKGDTRTSATRVIPIQFDQAGRARFTVATSLSFTSDQAPELDPKSGSLISKAVFLKEIRIRSKKSLSTIPCDTYKCKVTINLEPHFSGEKAQIDARVRLKSILLSNPIRRKPSVKLSAHL